MAQLCFTLIKLPMNCLMKNFRNIKNMKNGKMPLITTNFNGKDYFSICAMNPAFKYHVDKWW